jgi:type I site-specific restriction-modification system R (restriction) subunit
MLFRSGFDGDGGREELIKSYGSRFNCGVINCSHYNNLTNKRPAWTASENVEKAGEIERHEITKDTKKTQRNPGPRALIPD